MSALRRVRVRDAKGIGPGKHLDINPEHGIDVVVEQIRKLEAIDSTVELELFSEEGDPLTAEVLLTLEPNHLIRYEKISAQSNTIAGKLVRIILLMQSVMQFFDFQDIFESEKRNYQSQVVNYKILADIYKLWKENKVGH